MESDERAIRAVHTVWIDAVNAGDLARLLSMMGGGCGVFESRPGAVRSGRISRWIFGCPAKIPDTLYQRVGEVVVVGKVAYTRSRDSLSVTPRAGGKTTELAGPRITIYRKQTDRSWLLARDAPTL